MRMLELWPSISDINSRQESIKVYHKNDERMLQDENLGYFKTLNLDNKVLGEHINPWNYEHLIHRDF